MKLAQAESATATTQPSPETASQIEQIMDPTLLPSTEYFRGTVMEILDEDYILDPDQNQTYYIQQVTVQTTNDQGEQELLKIDVGSQFQPLTEQQRLQTHTPVVLATQPTFDGQTETIITDVFRLPVLTWLMIGFFLLVFLVGKLRGITSLLGMVASLAILFGYILPQILAGASPIMVSTIGASLIAVVTLYMSHGFNYKSHVALGSLLVTLFGVIGLSSVSVHAAQLVGLGSEEAAFVQFSSGNGINLQGLLLGGIILGALGVLDDIVVSQVSVVKQLHAANPKLKFEELFDRALDVGKDHVASLVNTLVLAYAGANLPLFILFYQSQEVPLWVSLNNELIAEEILRTIVGSFGLVMAVPLTTLVAAAVVKKVVKVEFLPIKLPVGKKR